MASPPHDESMYPIAVLVDELRDDDIALKLNSIRRLGTIALALGDTRTRLELLPYLLESKPEEDEIMVALAEEVGKLVPSVGGPEQAHCLVPLLEELAREDETVVREAAVKSLQIVGKEFNDEQATTHLVPCIKRLRQAEWFTARVSVCGLFAVTYPHCDADTKEALRTLYKELVRDETPMVRRAAALNIGAFATSMLAKDVQQHLVPLLTALLGDDQESVRKLALESTAELVKALNGEEGVTEVLDACSETVMRDHSWRVRHAVTGRMPDLATAFGSELSAERLTEPYFSMLTDQEPEVRVVAAETVCKFCEAAALPVEQMQQSILGPLKALSTDSSQHVRAALATSALQLAPRCGNNESASILDLILTLLKDRVPDVRLNIISNLHHAHELLGAEQLKSAVVPAIEDLTSDPMWRVRHAIIEKLPLLAGQLGSEFYEAKLLSKTTDWLHDQVATIREGAMAALIDVSEVFGEDWTAETALPLFLEHLENKFYLYRITTMQAIPKLSKITPPAVLAEKIMPSLLKTAADPVPNVKFNLCKVLEELAESLAEFQGLVTGQVLPVLKILVEDEDRDVRFFAGQALLHFTE